MVALLLTLLAVPAVWLITRDDDAPTGTVAAPDGAAAEVFDPLGKPPSLFEPDDSQVTVHTTPAVIVGTHDSEVVATARATYTKDAGDVGSRRCAFGGVESGTEVIVVNVGNGRSIECRIIDAVSADGMLTLHDSDFQVIGSLVDAPIHVEIRRQTTGDS